MSDLWIFGRRQAARVRYRHGGFNATFPMNFHTVEEQAGLFVERVAAQEAADRAPSAGAPVEGREAGNVIAFQPRADRGSRGAQAGENRLGRRPAPFSGPKTRD